MKLIEWQKISKNIDDFIVQSSTIDGRDRWQNVFIGMCWNYCTLSDEIKKDIQIGNHENLLLCAINSNTDVRRRGNQKVNRRVIINNLEKNGFTNLSLDSRIYLTSLNNYKFIVSPEGNGIDCHRHYEALMSGCIPICEYNKQIEEKYKDLPILYTTDYSEITNEYLESKYQEMLYKDYNFDKLFLSYYSPEVQSVIIQQGNYWCKKIAKKTYYK